MYFSRWSFEKAPIPPDTIPNCDEINLTPNPANNELRVWTKDNNLKLYIHKMEIYDSKGRSVFEGRISEDEMRIDLSQFAEGIYFFKIYVPGEEPCKVEKIVISRD